MAISKSYNIPGRGTVVTGLIKSGRCEVNGDLEVIGFKRNHLQTSIVSIESFNKPLEFG
jgi:translation elongation factor EF-Tu-like GTPase